MAASNQIHNALLTEHFRYTPLTLLDDIINTVNELVFRAVNAIEEGLNRSTPEDLGFRLTTTQQIDLPSNDPTTRQNALFDLKQNEIDTGIVQLESLLNATVDKDFDKFEIYTLRNILAVGHDEEEARDLARWVRLEHYKGLQLDGNMEEGPRPEDVQMQRRKLHETMKLNAMLRAEEVRNDAMLKQLKGALGGGSGQSDGQDQPSPLALLATSPHLSTQSGHQPLTQNVQYALTQLPALRQLLAQLKESMQSLPNARHVRENEDGVDATRRRYLDSQSRRALQRKGVEVPDEASRRAQTSITGRKISRDEVQGIEAVMQALGGAPAGRRGAEDEEMQE